MILTKLHVNYVEKRRSLKTEGDICGSVITYNNINRHLKHAHRILKEGEVYTKQKQYNNYARYLCTNCGKTISRKHKELIQKHKAGLCHETKHFCPSCDKEFENDRKKKCSCGYTRENCMIIYTGKTDNHNCDKCGETFAMLKQLEGHKVKCYNKKRKGGWKGHKCDYEGCSFATAHKERLEAHVRTKHLNLPLLLNHICPYCGNKYSGKKGLNSHIESHHTNPDHKPYQCSHCSKPFKTQQLVKMHEKIHSDVLSYMCSFCGKGFKQSAVLYRHKLNCQFKPE